MAAVVAAAGLAVVGALLLPGRGGGFEVTRADAGGEVAQGKAKGGRDASESAGRGRDEGDSVQKAKAEETKVAAAIVHVDGAVENPGVYRVYSSSPRVNDAVSAAGGLTKDADTTGSGLVDINTADATELQRLPGVGEATAAAIVEDRTRNGPFASPEDIMRVSGIGEKKFERMRAMIRV